jgi:hypothetical protein
MAPDPVLRRVGRFWAAYQARDWALAQSLLAPDAVCRWWATGECFEGAAAVVKVNAVYPEGWSIFLLELHKLSETRVLSLVRVEQDGSSFWANSQFRLGEAGILEIDEYWSDQAKAPAWRQGMGRALPADTRPGLSLDPASWV